MTEQQGQGWQIVVARLNPDNGYATLVAPNGDRFKTTLAQAETLLAALQNYDRLVQALEKARFAFAFLKDDDQGMDSHVLDDVEAEVCAALDTIQKKV